MPECDLKNEKCGGRCTGYDGGKMWQARKELNKKIDCESCRDEAELLETFNHDIVNAHLGKTIYDKKNWKKFVSIVNCADNACSRDGRC